MLFHKNSLYLYKYTYTAKKSKLKQRTEEKYIPNDTIHVTANDCIINMIESKHEILLSLGNLFLFNIRFFRSVHNKQTHLVYVTNIISFVLFLKFGAICVCVWCITTNVEPIAKCDSSIQFDSLQ